jgi:hypothetical protein
MSLWLARNVGRIPLGDKKEHKSKSLQGFYNKIMRHLANHLQGHKERKDVDEEIRDLCVEYCKCVGLESNWPPGISLGWKSKVLEQMARQSATMHTTHLETNLDIFAVRYLRFLIRSDPEFSSICDLSKKAYGKVFSAICDAFWERKNVTVVAKRRPTTLELFPIKHDIWKTAQQLVTRLMKLVPKQTSLSKKSEIMYQILCELEPFAADLQQKWLNGDDGKRKFGKSKWTFDLCPQLEWRPKHIQISTTALSKLIKELSKTHSHFKTIMSGLSEVDDDTCSYEKKYQVWSSIFNLKRVLRGKHLTDHRKLRFGCFMSTDGVSVAATIQQRKSNNVCKVIHIGDEIQFIKAKVWLLFCGQWAINCLARTLPNGLIKPLNIRQFQIPSHPFVFFHPWMKTLEVKKENLLKDIKSRNDKTLIHESVKDIVGLIKDEDGVYYCDTTIIGLDPGKKSAATWVYHNPKHQRKHKKWKGADGEHSLLEERYKNGSLGGGEWRFLSGQKQYTSKMNRRMTLFCPQWRNLSSTKTVDSSKLLKAYQEQMALWEQLENAFFSKDKWLQKQKMRKFCRHQKAMEDVVARIAGTKNKEEQKKVVIAYGDGDKNGTLRGTAPIMSTKLFKKVSQSCCVVVVNEHKTSKLCSCCHSEMKQFQKFRMKRCVNSGCIRCIWDRDINASINILNLFLELCHSADEDGKGQRLDAFRR